MRSALSQHRKLKELQAHWYGRLKEEGFRDIESVVGGREYLSEWSSFFQSKYDRLTFSSWQDYYYLANQLLHSHRFSSDIEKEIWALHTEGVACREIAKRIFIRMDVVLLKHAANKDIVNAIINKLKRVMLTNLEQRLGASDESLDS